MKVDQDLRHAITAASKANRELREDRSEQLQKAVDTFLKTPKGRAAAKKALALEAEASAYDAVAQKCRDKIDTILQPMGLCLGSRKAAGLSTNEAYVRMRRWNEDETEADFVASGGVLPEAQNRDWKPEEVIRQLAAAKDKKTFNAVLKKYNIIWE